MRIEAKNLVSADEFRGNWDRFLRRAKQGRGPIAVTENEQVVGVFMGAADYEAMAGRQVKKLLQERMKGPTISHEEAMARLDETVTNKKRKS